MKEEIELYHCSHKDMTNDDFSDLFFDGLFCSTSPKFCHGDVSSKFIVDKDYIATTFNLNHCFEYEKLKIAFDNVGSYLKDKYSYDVLLQAAIDDDATQISERNEDGFFEIDGDDSWELQRLRGQIAKNLGFKAVEMKDEHGTSYLVLENTNKN